MRNKLNLTDEEWMSVIDGEREGLPTCCANISALRDELISYARNGGTTFWGDHDQLRQKLHWCFPGHDPVPDAVQKIMDQISWVAREEEEHDPMNIEL